MKRLLTCCFIGCLTFLVCILVGPVKAQDQVSQIRHTKPVTGQSDAQFSSSIQQGAVTGTAMSDVGGGASAGGIADGDPQSNCQASFDDSVEEHTVINCGSSTTKVTFNDDEVSHAGAIRRPSYGLFTSLFVPRPGSWAMRIILISKDHVEGTNLSWYLSEQACREDIHVQRKNLPSMDGSGAALTLVCTRVVAG